MMQYCFEKQKLKCLFSGCCNLIEYQTENLITNISLLIILFISGIILCLNIFTLNNENSTEEIKNLNISFNPNKSMTDLSFSALKFGKVSPRGFLSDKSSPFTYFNSITSIFLNLSMIYLFIGKLIEILNIYNEFQFNSSLLDKNISNDKNILTDDLFLPKNIFQVILHIFGLIVAHIVYNLDSEFLDHNKKNIFTIIYFFYYFYTSINVYATKSVLLYENYLFFAIISLCIIITVIIYGIYINKIFFSKLSK